LEEFTGLVGSLPADTIRLSKNALLRLVRKLCKQNIPPESTPLKKNASPFLEKAFPVSLDFLENQKNIALKNLINEKFESSFGDNQTPKGGRGAAQTIQKLFQKEALFEQSLNLLAEDNVDLNQLLFCAFERIQSENFDVPKEAARLLDGDFQFEDRLQMPRSKWLSDSQTAQQMRIELGSLTVNEGNET
jgi:hypothetical protein